MHKIFKKNTKLFLFQLIFLINRTDVKTPSKEIKPPSEEKMLFWKFNNANNWDIIININTRGNLNLKNFNLYINVIAKINEI